MKVCFCCLLITAHFPLLYLPHFPHFPKFSFFSNIPLKSSDSLVDMESRIRAGEKNHHGSNTVSVRGFFSSPKRPDNCGTYPAFCAVQTRALEPRIKPWTLKFTTQFHLLPMLGTEWSYDSTPPYVFLGCRGTNLPVPSTNLLHQKDERNPWTYDDFL
jgi:hypothetical protein